jgi:Domain of unknown function (DUF4160)
MPTVARIGPYRLYFFSNETNEPAHIHVDRESSTVKIWLAPVSLAANGGFRPHELRAILGIVREHESELFHAWNAFFTR